MSVVHAQTQENSQPNDPFPWTVMIKYAPTGRTFFITEIEADSPEEAVAFVLSLGYSLPKDKFEMSAKRVASLPSREFNANPNQNESVPGKQVAAGPSVRATATRK